MSHRETLRRRGDGSIFQGRNSAPLRRGGETWKGRFEGRERHFVRHPGAKFARSGRPAPKQPKNGRKWLIRR